MDVADSIVVRTGDGSHTLHNPHLGKPYHSVHGAVSESTHVFIKAGLERWEEVASSKWASDKSASDKAVSGKAASDKAASGKSASDKAASDKSASDKAASDKLSSFKPAGHRQVGKPHVRVLEVGLGTGLNLLLTWVRCLEGKCSVHYTALEPHPLPRAVLEALGHAGQLAWPGLHAPFLDLMTAAPHHAQEAEGGLTFLQLDTPVQDLAAAAQYEVVYYDAFAPSAAPHMWTAEVFARLYAALVPGGVLVTYCAKGDVRRSMQSAGFRVERLPGPPGKREMLRATRPPL